MSWFHTLIANIQKSVLFRVNPAPTGLCACCGTESFTTLHQIPINAQSLDIALCESCVQRGVHTFANRIALCTATFLTEKKPVNDRLTADEMDRGWP